MVEFILKKDKKHNSLCQIKKEDTIIYLTEKELEILIEDIYEKRRDAFDNIPVLTIMKQEIDDLKSTVNNLYEEMAEMQSDMDDLEDELNEYRED
jgi:FtsZ-binding cell division protein ZapB